MQCCLGAVRGPSRCRIASNDFFPIALLQPFRIVLHLIQRADKAGTEICALPTGQNGNRLADSWQMVTATRTAAFKLQKVPAAQEQENFCK